MQVVLKIYVYYNDKLFGIFQSGFISTKSLVSMALQNMEHCTLLILLHVLCLAQFSLNNVHKRGLKYHNFIYMYYVGNFTTLEQSV